MDINELTKASSDEKCSDEIIIEHLKEITRILKDKFEADKSCPEEAIFPKPMTKASSIKYSNHQEAHLTFSNQIIKCNSCGSRILARYPIQDIIQNLKTKLNRELDKFS